MRGWGEVNLQRINRYETHFWIRGSFYKNYYFRLGGASKNPLAIIKTEKEISLLLNEQPDERVKP